MCCGTCLAAYFFYVPALCLLTVFDLAWLSPESPLRDCFDGGRRDLVVGAERQESVDATIGCFIPSIQSTMAPSIAHTAFSLPPPPPA